MSESITIKIKTLGRAQAELQTTIHKGASVPELKAHLADLSGVAANQQRLIYLGKVLKDDMNISDYNIKEGGTLHLVASSAPPANPGPAANSPAPAPSPSPASAPRTTTNVVMGVLPSGSGGAPPLDQILSNVLGSIGLAGPRPNTGSSPGTDAAARGVPPSQGEGTEASNGTASTLERIVASLESQVAQACQQAHSGEPAAPSSGPLSAAQLGSLLQRTNQSIEQLQPLLAQVGQGLQQDATLQGEARQQTQRDSQRLFPALQQLSSTLALLASSLGTLRLGDRAGEARVSDTSQDAHRTFVGPQGNVSIHIANANLGEAGTGQVQNLLQNILGSLHSRAAPGAPSNASAPAAEGAPSPATGGNGSSSSESGSSPAGAAPGNAAAPDLMGMMQQMFQGGAGGPLGSMVEQLASQMNGSGEGAASPASSGLSPLLGMLGSHQTRSLATLLNLEDPSEESVDSFEGLMNSLLHRLTFQNLLELRDGNWSATEQLRPFLASRVNQALTNKSEAQYTEEIVATVSDSMDENRLPAEILRKKKEGAHLTSTALQVLRERSHLLLQWLRTEPAPPTPEVPYPFSYGVRDWTVCTVGLMVDRLATCMQGGQADAVMVVHFFLSDRLIQMNPLLGPMAAGLLSPMIDRAFALYQAQPASSRQAPSVPQTPLRLFSASELDSAPVEAMIERDVERQASLETQRPFSDVYQQGMPKLLQQRKVPTALPPPDQQLEEHYRTALSRSGVSNPSDNTFTSLVEGDAALADLYRQEMRQAIARRLRTDKDFSADRFPSSARVFDPKP